MTATLSTGGAVGIVKILANDMQFPDFVGFYKVTYIVPAGASSLSIFVSNIHISGSPFSISGVSSTGSVDLTLLLSDLTSVVRFRPAALVLFPCISEILLE